jgi:Large ribosomal RNA subunit accumulation protein YceD
MAEDAPFVRPVRVESVPEGGVAHDIEASEVERQALAKLNGLPAIGRLTAKFSLSRAGRGIIRVRGDVHAEVTQTCVVSLEPFDVVLTEPVDVRFAPLAGESSNRRGPPIAPAEAGAFAIGDEDEPDSIVDGRIDLGALAAEFVILGLDPYPRKPGVDFSAPPADNEKVDSPTARSKKS